MVKERSVWSNLPASDRFILSIGTKIYKSLQEAHSFSRNVPGILAVSMTLGILTALEYRHGLTPNELISLGGKSGLFIIGIPYIIGIIISLIINRNKLAPKSINRGDVVFSAAMAFWFFTGAMLFGYLFAKITPLAANDVLTLSGAASFGAAFLGYLVLTEDFTTSFTLSAPLTIPILIVAHISTQTLFPMPSLGASIVQAILIYSVILIDMGLVFFTLEHIFRSQSGMGGMEFLNMFLSLLSGSKSEMEAAFERIGSKTKTFVGSILFKGKSKDVLWVIPSIHPGPFVGLGGAGMPRILQKVFSDKEVFCFHGPSNHDLNPVSRKELSKLVKFVKVQIANMKFTKNASKFEKLTNGKVTFTRQVIGGKPVHVAYKNTGTSEDINANVGAVIALQKDSPILIDGHNRLERKMLDEFWHSEMRQKKETYMEESINYGDDAAFEMFSLFKKVSQNSPEIYPLKLGTAQITLGSVERGIGEMGIQVGVLRTGTQSTAYILIDGNNMIDGLREKLELAASKFVDAVVISTTDNHDVNSLTSDLNPIGEKMPQAKIVAECKRAIVDAINDLEPVKAGAKMGVMSDMKFLGRGKPEQIILATRAFVSLSKVMLPSTALLLLALGFLSVVAI